jgi:uncharacterized membrane protein YfcA
MDTAIFILTMLAVGAGVGLMSAALGIGGGTLMVPAFLWLIPQMDINTAKGSSLFAIVFVAGYHAWEARRAGIRTPWDVVAACAGGSIAGGYAGGAISALLSDAIVTWLFIALLMFAALRTFLLGSPRVDESRVRRRIGLSVLIGFAAGVVGGGTGTGGGAILVPLALWAGIVSNERVVPLSNTVMVATSAAGALAHAFAHQTVDLPYTYGLVNVSLAPLVCIAAIAATRPGRWVNSRLSLPRRRLVMGTLLAVIAARLALDAL